MLCDCDASLFAVDTYQRHNAGIWLRLDVAPMAEMHVQAILPIVLRSVTSYSSSSCSNLDGEYGPVSTHRTTFS